MIATGRTSTALLIALSSLGLFIAAGIGAYGELSPYFSAGITPQQRINSLASRSYQPGASTASKAFLLEDCQTVTRSLLGRAQPADRRAGLIEACADYARQFVEDAPSNALAWTVSAEMAIATKNLDAFRRGLAMSRRVAPLSNWIASQRVLLANKHYIALDDAGRQATAEDIRLLLGTINGTEFLAHLYVDQPIARERLISVAETMTDAEKVRFLGTLKRIKAEEGVK